MISRLLWSQVKFFKAEREFNLCTITPKCLSMALSLDQNPAWNFKAISESIRTYETGLGKKRLCTARNRSMHFCRERVTSGIHCYYPRNSDQSAPFWDGFDALHGLCVCRFIPDGLSYARIVLRSEYTKVYVDSGGPSKMPTDKLISAPTEIVRHIFMSRADPR